MKRKHYPLLTGIGVALLTLAPLLLWYGFSRDRSSIEKLPDLALADLGATTLKAVPVIEQETSKPHVAPAADSALDHASVKPALVTVGSSAASHIAELDKQHPAPRREAPAGAPAAAAVSESPEMSVEQSSAMVSAQDSDGPAPPVQQDAPEFPRRSDATGTYYQATGHLAMQTAVPLPESSVNVSDGEFPSEPTAFRTDESEKHESAPARSRREKNRKSKNANQSVAGQEPAAPPKSNGPAAESVTAATAANNNPGQIEDVLVQTPAETAPVARVENVLARTSAKGWPVAIVKSDLPDDVWWVQQMVGIQGDAFAARVNFGNEFSLEGSTYRMVIVFLDSADEVRRFRIAKQFKEIPEGVRRSREFIYVRN